MRVEVLLALRVQDRRVQVSKVRCGLRHLKLLACLHDSFEVGHEARTEDVVLRQLEIVEKRGSNPRILLIVHADEGDAEGFVGRLVDRNVDAVLRHVQVLVRGRLDDQAFELADLGLFALRQLVDDEVVGEVVVDFRRVWQLQWVHDFSGLDLDLLLEVFGEFGSLLQLLGEVQVRVELDQAIELVALDLLEELLNRRCRLLFALFLIGHLSLFPFFYFLFNVLIYI